jgi:hypothetical protein
MTLRPRYPIYVPSKSRADVCSTPQMLRQDSVPFFLVVEPQQADAYAARFGSDCLLMLPFSDVGSVIPARNWIKEHATATGADRHWQLDDNITYMERTWGQKRVRCDAGTALRVCEDFADRYENVGIAGLNYHMFGFTNGRPYKVPFFLNVHVYSCSLVLNNLPYRWRGRYNEDTDYCLQALAGGWCTVLLNGFLANKMPTMTVKGGNTAELYKGDGRLKMARSLERVWPGVVAVNRRFRRPQHIVYDAWKRFDTPLRLKPGIDLAALPPNEYGLELRTVREPKSPRVKAIAERWQAEHA